MSEIRKLIEMYRRQAEHDCTCDGGGHYEFCAASLSTYHANAAEAELDAKEAQELEHRAAIGNAAAKHEQLYLENLELKRDQALHLGMIRNLTSQLKTQ